MKKQQTSMANYIKIDRDPMRQAAVLRQLFPATGTPVFRHRESEEKSPTDRPE